MQSSAKPDRLLLASASPRRSELLSRMGLQFETQASHVEEDDSGSHGPSQMVLENARRKAAAMAEQFPSALVLGSDTTVALGESVLSKPVDLDDARRMLRRLSGRSHRVYTAVALHWNARAWTEAFVETSEVTFHDLDAATIERYFERCNPLDKAGGYGIQEEGGLVVKSVVGSIENVMGLPIQALEAVFDRHGFDFRK